MNELTFKSHKLNPVIINGYPHLGVSQIATALQYSQPQRVIEMYTRHADEFSADMSFLTTTDTAGGKQQIRVFSLRGCHLLAMFSKTPVAKEFRKWVLDLIESRYSVADKPVLVSEHTRALPSGKREIVLSEKAKAEIGGIVKACLGTSKAGAQFKIATAYEQKAFEDTVRRLVKEALREELAGFLLKDGVKPSEAFNGKVTADGLPAANWALGIIHGASALQNIIGQLTDKQKEAVKLLA